MDEDFKKAIRLAVTTLQDRVDNLEGQVIKAHDKIDRLERELSFMETATIAQIQRDVYSVETDVRNHDHR